LKGLGASSAELTNAGGLVTQKELSVLRAEMMRLISMAVPSTYLWPAVVINVLMEIGQVVNGITVSNDNIGCIAICPTGIEADGNSIVIAKPLKPYFIRPPQIGETVLAITSVGSTANCNVIANTDSIYNSNTYYVTDLNLFHNTQENIVEYKRLKTKQSAPNIGTLPIKNGDHIYCGRQGQRIKFTSENNNQPRMVIYNDQLNDAVTEDVNSNYSIIWLTSNDVVDVSWPSTRDNSIRKGIPSKLSGKQIIISADRLIIVAKTNEVLINAKDRIHLSSTSGVGVDSSKQIQLSAPKIYLGDDDTNRAVLGNELRDWLVELVDTLSAMTFTVSTAPGTTPPPNNVSNIVTLKTKLVNTLSKIVFVS